MTHKEAIEIKEVFEKYKDISCTCFQGNPPCGKCVDCPTEDDYFDAMNIIAE